MDAVRWYINVGNKNVNKPDKNGCTALFYTVQKNHVVLVKDLIKAGAGKFDIYVYSYLDKFIDPIYGRSGICRGPRALLYKIANT